jgi:ribonuclease HII
MTSRPPIAMLRRMVASADDAALETWIACLRADPRAGARLLADTAARRLAASNDERLRLARLFARADALRARGTRDIAGVDEVGMGPLAGPVVAAAVVLPAGVRPLGIDDSKRLTSGERARLDAEIRTHAVAISVAEVAPDEIDRLNIYRAGLEAMRRAVDGLAVVPGHVLVDARTIPGLTLPQTAIVHGDASEGAIAAASIVAKVHRDALMERLDARHPGYGFARHKGYPTVDHVAALRRLGPCAQHRRSFAPVAAVS